MVFATIMLKFPFYLFEYTTGFPPCARERTEKGNEQPQKDLRRRQYEEASLFKADAGGFAGAVHVLVASSGFRICGVAGRSRGADLYLFRTVRTGEPQ